MNNESTRVSLRLGPDPLMVTVVHGAAMVAASQAGFDDARCAEFARAAEEVCRESMLQLSDTGMNLEITLETFADRIEISIHQRGYLMPALGLDTFVVRESCSGRPGGISGVELLTCVDRVTFKTEDGVARTTLVKFRPPNT